MLDLNDLNFIYKLIESSNITGSDAERVIQLKYKIIDIVKAVTAKMDEAKNAHMTTPPPIVTPAPVPEVTPEASSTANPTE